MMKLPLRGTRSGPDRAWFEVSIIPCIVDGK
jgi:hypothetical protein